MNTKSDVTEEDIRHAMNFDSLLEKVTKQTLLRQKFNTRLRSFLIVAGVFTMAGFGYFYYTQGSSTTDVKERSVSSAIHDTTDTTKNTIPQQSIKPTQQEKPPALTKPQSKQQTKKLPPEKTVVTSAPYLAAEPRDGFPALYDYINHQLRYPAVAIPDSVAGIVTIRFVVDETGTASHFTILNSLNPDCDLEALRVIEKMPPWKPATLDGRPVPSNITIPITFSISTERN